jgi:hypothetical protein
LNLLISMQSTLHLILLLSSSSILLP